MFIYTDHITSVKIKGCAQLVMETHLKVTGCQTPATWDHTVLPDTDERAPPYPQPSTMVLDIPTPED